MFALAGLGLLLSAMAHAGPTPAAPPATDKGQWAIFDLTVNQAKRDEITVLLRNGEVLVRVADLEKAGLRAFEGKREQLRGEPFVTLSSLAPGIAYHLDEKALILTLVADVAYFGSEVVDLRAARPQGLTYSHDNSGFLNYSVSQLNFNQYQFFTEGGFSVGGNLLYSSLSRTAQGQIVRGLSNFTLDNLNRLTRVVVGDSFAGSADPLGGGAFLGGISFSRNFALDPYFIRYPSQRLAGSVTTPSTVDIYSNGLLVKRENLAPGQFVLQNLPVVAGSGSTRVVIRDAFGGERDISSPYYLSTQLLERGLAEYSYNLGVRRTNVALSSWEYGPLAFSASHRIGLTEWLTPGFRLEGQPGSVSGGPGLTLGSFLGEFTAFGAASDTHGKSGMAGSLSYRYFGYPVSFGGAVQVMTSRYTNLALRLRDDRPLFEADAFAGLPLNSRITLASQYSYIDSRDRGYRQVVQGSASIRLTDKCSLFVTHSYTLSAVNKPVTDIFGGLSYFFGGSTVATLSYDRQNSSNQGMLALQKSLPVGSGFGYLVQAQEGTTEQQNSFLQYQGPYGRYEFDYNRIAGRDLTTLNLAGALVGIGGHLFATRPIQDSYALLRVPDVADVRGYVSNQEVGRTNRSGEVLVPNLLSYYGNQLSIDDRDIPLNHSVENTERVVATPYRGGAVVSFPVARFQGFTGKVVVEAAGAAVIPAYGELVVSAAGKPYTSPIGRNGEIYLENVPAGRHEALVEYKDGDCKFPLDIPDSPQSFVKLGTLRCVMR